MKQNKPALWICFALFVVCYTASASLAAARIPAWMDEVLTLWAIRLPSAADVYSALAHGSEFSPPVYLIALHYYMQLAGGSLLALRLPSIAAALVTGGCTFVLLRRHLGLARACFGACLVLESVYNYAVQMRPYSAVTAVFALALLLWDSLNRKPAWWRSVLIGLLLALAISMHFYAVLFVVCMGLIELLYTFHTRKVRFVQWCALTAAGASILIWLPLIHASGRYAANDSNGLAYYARPLLFSLVWAYTHLFLDGYWVILPLLAAFVTVLIGRALNYSDDIEEQPDQAGLTSIVLGLLLLPLLVFLFSKAVTKTFNERYLLATVIGSCALIAASIPPTAFFRRMAPLILLFATFLTLNHTHTAPKRDATFASHVPGPYPIVVADGLQYFPLAEGARSEIKSRIAYMTLPEGTPSGDLTNEHQIKRWKAINPNLFVEDSDRFLRENANFYVVDMQTSDDTPAHYLLEKHRIELVDQVGNTLIYKSRVP
jgi:hypothetical protein